MHFIYFSCFSCSFPSQASSAESGAERGDTHLVPDLGEGAPSPSLWYLVGCGFLHRRPLLGCGLKCRDRVSRWLKALTPLPKWDSLGSQCIPGGSIWCPRMESYSVRPSDPHVSVCLQKCEAAIREQFPTGSVSRRGRGWGDSACFLMLRGAVPVSPKTVHTELPVFLEAEAEITWLAFT